MIMSQILTISGQKGGTGKSVTAVNLAASFALFGKKTLLVDCDPQGCSTRWSGFGEKSYNCGIKSVLSVSATDVDAIKNTNSDFLDIMPAGFTLLQAALKLSKNPGSEKFLRLFLKDIKDEYEYIIIDPPSSYGFLSVAAMTASDYLLVCMSVHNSCLEDFHNLVKMVKYIRENYSVPLKISGFLFNRCETKEDITSFLDQQNLLNIKKMIFDNFIPEDKNIKKSIELKTPALLYDIKGKAAKAYLNFAEELHSFFN